LSGSLFMIRFFRPYSRDSRNAPADGMPAGRLLAAFANVPDRQRRDGLPQPVIQGKHPVVAVPVCSRRRHKVRHAIKELNDDSSTTPLTPRRWTFRPRPGPIQIPLSLLRRPTDGNDRTLADLRRPIGDHFCLADGERAELPLSGTQARFVYRLRSGGGAFQRRPSACLKSHTAGYTCRQSRRLAASR